jgi:hypothetical protein
MVFRLMGMVALQEILRYSPRSSNPVAMMWRYGQTERSEGSQLMV